MTRIGPVLAILAILLVTSVTGLAIWKAGSPTISNWRAAKNGPQEP